MGFKDRYTKTEEKNEVIFQNKITEDLKNFASDLQEKIDKNGGEFPEEKKQPTKKDPDKIGENLIKKVTKKFTKKEKPFLNISIMGDTVEVKDFRAICKKNGWQMNNTLKKLLHEWNTANYNL